MWWKKLSYWFKGGIAGFIISFTLHVIYHFNRLSFNSIADCYDPVARKGVACYTGNLFSAVFYSPMFYVLIIAGILIGWIYGFFCRKNKKRKY
ncbi:Uncharacterised protein [uncultured archaeon]|nr:Uncharacterised protein [uncultured archaeon]